MESGCVIVLTTVGSVDAARGLALVLVAERLAACVNVLAEMESTYQWDGAVQTEPERQLVIKTTASRVPALQARLQELHPYQLPEFLVLPIDSGSEAYLRWLRESTSGTG
jgi:periplasmic divalent cation tolerance protein